MIAPKLLKIITVAAVVPLLAACERSGQDDDVVVDGGLDGGPLKDGVAAIWIDPDGCQHWFIDDGIEGYMSPRLNRDGTPRCTPREDVRAPFLTKDGSTIQMEAEPGRQ